MDSLFFLSDEWVRQIAKKYDTPLYVYDEKRIIEAADQALAVPNPYGLTVRYAIKALSTAAILRIFDSKGLHFDASSAYEAYRLLEIGIAPEKILLTAQELSEETSSLIRKGVHYTAVSLHQLEYFGREFPGAKLSVRINPGIGSGHSKRTNVGGILSSFGIWHAYLPEIIDLAHRHSLKIERLHLHVGSGSDPNIWRSVAIKALEFAKQLPHIRFLNLGGGFKVARMPGEKTTDIYQHGADIYMDIETFYQETGRKLHLEIEPGTFLIARAGCLIASINDKVDTGKDGYTFLKLNTGMNDITRPTLYGVQHPLRLVTSAERAFAPNESVVVVGHNCESGDILTPQIGHPEETDTITLPEANIGDLIVIGAAGAYVSSMSFVNYNSFPRIAEVLRGIDNECRIIRRQETLSDIIHLER